MKNLTVLFVFLFTSLFVQSQSLAKEELSGTWQVINVVDPGDNPVETQKLYASYIDFNTDGTFQIRYNTEENSKRKLTNLLNNSQWKFNSDTSSVDITNSDLQISAYKRDGKYFFKLLNSGAVLEVIKPI